MKPVISTENENIVSESNTDFNQKVEENNSNSTTEDKSEEEIQTQKIVLNTQNNEYAVSALSLKSIKRKKELEASLSKATVNPEDLPKEDFTFEEMIEHWDFIADRFYKTGRMLMYSTMKMSVPQLNGHVINIELPNEGSKISFDENKYDLVNYLRKKLNNYGIEIHIEVNEEIKIKKAFTIEDKYNHLLEKNPDLELLVKTFDLNLKQ
ncbi:hypothetical protein EG240_07320 [Paenimyroides tangerinum]|uniref:DNA polymerase III subunit gamma/tau n=1 Tax=Paenimyroides tangerinum TaxID=2488728 RepID=A0A3P3WEM3_9FLAO|nr:hypothetical protein [Paenimyroides tangerinum]RRJ91003.1 hypothetical protein EG240_07320 [Paenimyroides tangerinum]